MSSKGYRWYNNGKIQICIRFDKDPPEGFVRGCLQHSERQNKEHSEYLKNAYAGGKLVNPRVEERFNPLLAPYFINFSNNSVHS